MRIIFDISPDETCMKKAIHSAMHCTGRLWDIYESERIGQSLPDEVTVTEMDIWYLLRRDNTEQWRMCSVLATLGVGGYLLHREAVDLERAVGSACTKDCYAFSRGICQYREKKDCPRVASEMKRRCEPKKEGREV